MSDSLRLTNGFRDRATDLLPRVSLCFVAEDRGSAQRLSTAYPHLYFLLPDGVCYHGHTVTGGKKTGAGPLAMKREARELTVALAQRQSVLDDQVARLNAISQEIAGLEAEVERLRSLQQAREKDRVALDHDVRKLAEDLSRANSKVSVARLELERLRRDAEKSLGERERNRVAVEEKERQRAAREEALEAQRQEAEKLETEAAAIGEEHGATRAALAGLEERHRGERNAMGRLQQQFQETANRRNATAAEIERLGEQRARLLKDNIELDRRGAELGAGISRMEAAVNQMAVEDGTAREALRAGEEELKTLRQAVQESQERRAQIEVELVRKQAELKYLDETSRKELNCPVEELGPGRRSAAGRRCDRRRRAGRQ